MIEVIGGIRTPRCDCRPNTQGELCYIPPAACDGNPCQNSGICSRKIQPDNTQVCCVISHYDFHVDLVLLCSILFSNRVRNYKRPLNVLARTDLTAFFVNKKLNQIICFS